MKSVILMGDAGVLPLSSSNSSSKKSSMNFCCTSACTGDKEKESETNLKPQGRRSIKKMPVVKSHGPPRQWQWSQDVIREYTDTDTMKRQSAVGQGQGMAYGQQSGSFGKRKASTSGSRPVVKSSFGGGHQGSHDRSGSNGYESGRGTFGQKKSSVQYDPYSGANVSQLDIAMKEQDLHEQIGKKYNKVFDHQMKQGKARLDQQFTNKNNSLQFQKSSNFQNQYKYQMEMMRQRIKFDVAWQIFDEVNVENDTLKHVDLSCLDFEDAIVIAKQKIYELAKHASLHSYQSTDPYVLNIKCAEDHLILMEDEFGRTPLKNCVLEMVQKELHFDHYYIPTLRTILIKLDHGDLKRLEQINNREQNMVNNKNNNAGMPDMGMDMGGMNMHQDMGGMNMHQGIGY